MGQLTAKRVWRARAPSLDSPQPAVDELTLARALAGRLARFFREMGYRFGLAYRYLTEEPRPYREIRTLLIM